MQPKAARNISIEALRLVAVAGIAVFHTFQWTFQATCVGAAEYAPLAMFPYSGVLGFINLLGCWANEVFFMISGYFLIASAARAWDGGATWKSQMQRTAQRFGKVIMPTAFYCLVALAWSTVVSPIPDVTLNTHYWYTLGLEFIWVYAATVFMAPWFGLAKSRLPQKSYTATVIAVGILVFVVNGYLAAMSATSAGEFSWLQKLMSANTYVVAFLIGGLLRDVTDTMDSDRDGRLGHALARNGFGAHHHPGRRTLLHRQPHGNGNPLLQIDLADLVCPRCRLPALCGYPTQCLRQFADCRCHRHLIDRHARFLCDAVAHQ